MITFEPKTWICKDCCCSLSINRLHIVIGFIAGRSDIVGMLVLNLGLDDASCKHFVDGNEFFIHVFL